MKKTTYFPLITAFILLLNPGLAVFAQTPPILTPIISQNTPQNINKIAQGITVKIIVGDLNGSGGIVAKNGTKYTVITNAHVVSKKSTYTLQTPDGKTHQATLKQKGESLQGNDLAILEFQANVNYPVAQFGDPATLKEGDKIYSAGFPLEGDKLTLTQGEITYISPKPIKGGYQIAYNQETQQGMSGGALLNAEGKLIGIIGMSQAGALTILVSQANDTGFIEENDAEAYNNRGNLYYNQQKWDLALRDFNKAIELNPKYADAYNNRGVLYYNQQKWDLALADFNKAIELNPNFAEAYYNRGLLYYNQQKWGLALGDFNKAVELNPNSAEAYNNRGLLYINQQKWDLALADFNKAIELNPNSAEAYANRGITYIQKGDRQKGIADLQKAAELFKEQGRTSDYQRAIQILQQLGE